MEPLEIGAIVGIGFFAAKYLGYFKGFKMVSKKTALILAIAIAAVSAYNWNWGGVREYVQQATVPGAGEQQVTAGVTFEAEGAAGTNTVYDAATRTFVCSYVENTTANTAVLPTTYAALSTCTATITVYRTDTLSSSDNAVSKISAMVPTFYGAAGTIYASVQYAAVGVDTTSGKYQVAFTPAGTAARYMYNFFTVGSGGSKAITVTGTPTSAALGGLSQKDNFGSSTIEIDIVGLNQPFYLRFVKVGEVA